MDSKPPDHQGSPFQPFILQVFLQVSNLRTPQGSLSAWLHVGAARSSDSLLGGVFAHVSDVSVILGLFLMPTWGFRPQGFFMWLELLIAPSQYMCLYIFCYLSTVGICQDENSDNSFPQRSKIDSEGLLHHLACCIISATCITATDIFVNRAIC